MTLLLILVLLLAVLLWRRTRSRPPRAGYSHLASLQVEMPSWRVQASGVPRLLLFAALFIAGLGLLDFRISVLSEQVPTPPPLPPERQEEQSIPLPSEGIAIYLVLDRSGSMRTEINLADDQGLVRRMTRMDLLKSVTRQFVRGSSELGLAGRSNDLIGLVAFARVANVLAPLTLDHATLLEQLSDLAPVDLQDRDGTAIGYALFKTANLIAATRYYAQELVREGEPNYAIQSSVIVLVTDGDQQIHPLDRGHPRRSISLADAAQYAAEQAVRVYIVNIEPALALPQFTKRRQELANAAQSTGGELFIMNSGQPLATIYRRIEALERSQLPVAQEVIADALDLPDEEVQDEPREILVPLFPYFVGISLLVLSVALLLEIGPLRRLP